jgi:hypothetical protein
LLILLVVTGIEFALIELYFGCAPPDGPDRPWFVWVKGHMRPLISLISRAARKLEPGMLWIERNGEIAKKLAWKTLMAPFVWVAKTVLVRYPVLMKIIRY